MEVFVFVSAVFLLVCQTSTVGGSQLKNRHVITNGRPVIWKSNTQTDVRLEFLGSTKLSLTLRCNFEIVTLWSRYLTREFKFCFDYGDPFLHTCATLNLKKRKTVLKIGSVPVQLEYNPMKFGAEAKIDNVPPESELPLFYATCQEKTNVGVITSNRLFVLDLRRNFPKTVWRRSEPFQLNKKGPSTLECLQKSLGISDKLHGSKEPWRQPLVPVTFEWFFCAKQDMTACQKEKLPVLKLSSFSDWPVQVRENGQLYSPFVPEKVAKKIAKKRLLCYVMNKPVAFYEAPLQILDKVPAKPAVFKMIRPQGIETVTIFDSEYFFKLPCLFDVPREQAFKLKRTTNLWQNSKNIAFTFPPNTSDINIHNVTKLSMLRTWYSESFKMFFNCSVISGNTTISGSYLVGIISPPRLKSTVKKDVKAIHGQTASTECLFEDQVNMTLGLAVCGKNVDWNNSEAISAAQQELNTLYGSLLPPLTFDVNVTESNGNKVIKYTETNITYRWNYMATAHIVTCIASRGMFMNRGWIRFVVERERPSYALECKVPPICDKACDFGCELVNLTALVFDPEAASKIAWYMQENVIDSSWGELIGNKFQFNYFYPKHEPATKRVTVSAQILHQVFRDYALFNESKSWSVQFNPWITTRHRNTIFQCLVVVIFVSAAIGGIACFLLSRRHGFQNEDAMDDESERRLTEA